MRTIQVSTDVFAAIWRDRRDGEVNEDQILRRKFGLESAPPRMTTDESKQGFYDARFDARFAEGFEIFRTYLGAEYRARAEGGAWKLVNTGVSCGSLNELSSAIGVKRENAWLSWFYRDENGKRKAVTEMRDQNRIHRRRETPIEELL